MSLPIDATTCDDERQPDVAQRDTAVSRELIRLESITKTYHLGEVDVPVLKGVSLSITRGEMVALMGASGSGKTTLMNILGCLDRPSSGQFWLDGQEMSRLSPDERALVRTSKLGFVFQSFNLLPRTSALHNVLMPLDYALRRPHRNDARRLAASLLTQVGLATRADHEPSQMSGGQMQRVAIARALVNHPIMLLADEPTGNLDSRTGDEILRMFQRLKAQGITILLVTHDPKVAGYADRTIHIADGLIADYAPVPSADASRAAADLSDTLPEGAPSPASLLEPDALDEETRNEETGDGALLAAATEARAPKLVAPATARGPSTAGEDAKESGLPAGPDALLGGRQSLAGSLLPPTLRTALDNLRRNKMRSALTALGVIIGVGAVIAMTEIGEGSKAAIDKAIASMGTYKLTVFPGAAQAGGVSQGTGTVQTLKPGDVDAIAQQCPAVAIVVPMVWARAQAIYGKRNWSPGQLNGTAPEYLATRDWEVEEGSCFNDEDVRACRAVCLVGTTIKRELFEDESPLNKMIRLRNVRFRVIGVLSPKGANSMGQDQDDCILAPWTTIKFRLNSGGAGSSQTAAAATTATVNTLSNTYVAPTPLYPQAVALQSADTPQPVRMSSIDFIQAQAANAEMVPVAIDQIAALLRERHHRAEGQEDFRIVDMTEVAQASARTAELMGILLLVVAAISLVVGGVGIMNIMLVSVTERTREIGLRMAVGARRHHILQQFLVEAVLLCLAGGVLGILVGRGASILIREIEHWATGVSVPAIVISVFVAAGVGIVFGFYPAWKASRLDPIEALRHE
jgi:macrolide transport system ATP-binding/permease protein